MINTILLPSIFQLPFLASRYLRLGRFIGYREYYRIYEETDRYVLKTAENWSEIFQLMLLRYRVFLSKNTFFSSCDIDLDKYDFTCDHIMIIDKETGKVVGTYRLRSSTYTKKYYSQSEFSLGSFLLLPGVKLELGRACIDSEYRNGAVIDLLWRGIAKYARTCGARYLFGCSSVKTLDVIQARQYINYLEKIGGYGEAFDIKPIGKFKREIPFMTDCLGDDIELPPLLRVYLNGGAKVYGEPAFDKDFQCIDFITIMDLNNLQRSFKRRYFGD